MQTSLVITAISIGMPNGKQNPGHLDGIERHIETDDRKPTGYGLTDRRALMPYRYDKPTTGFDVIKKDTGDVGRTTTRRSWPANRSGAMYAQRRRERGLTRWFARRKKS